MRGLALDCATLRDASWNRCEFLLGHVLVQTTELYLGCMQWYWGRIWRQDSAIWEAASAPQGLFFNITSPKNLVLACGKIHCGIGTMFTQMGAIRVDGTPSEVEGLTAERVRRSIMRVLDGTPLGAWATITIGGEAHVNTAYYSYSEDLVLYFMSHPQSLHCLNVSANSSMAVAIFASEQKWTDPGRGLQLFGRCDQLTGGDAEIAERAYGQRFRAYADWKGSLKSGDAAMDYRFYRFVPHTVKVLDEAEFGDAVWVEVQVDCRS